MGRRAHRLPLLAALLLVAALAPAAALGAGSGKARLKEKVGWGPRTDAAAAKRVELTTWEPRPENYVANHTVPSAAELALFRAQSEMPYQRFVDGQYTGSTDDIIEWAANKWGLPEDTLRAVAVQESWWKMSTVGDNGDSFGLFQMRRPYHCCLPFMRDSTAFNADYYGGIIRAYYDGKMPWLNDPDIRVDNGEPYRAGDLWGSIGAWFSGRWHASWNAPYIAGVKRNLRERTWATDPWF